MSKDKVTHSLTHSFIPRQRDQLSGFRTIASYLLLLRAGKAGGWQRHSVWVPTSVLPRPLSWGTAPEDPPPPATTTSIPITLASCLSGSSRYICPSLSLSLCVCVSLAFSLCQSPFSISVSVSVTLTYTHTHTHRKSVLGWAPLLCRIYPSHPNLSCGSHTASHSITYALPPCHTHNLRITPSQMIPSQHTESHSQSLAEMHNSSLCHMMLCTVS